MTRYQISEEAQQDLETIWQFIAVEKESVHNAEVVINYLFTAMDKIAHHPEIGHSRLDVTDRPVLFYKTGKYYVLYTTHVQPIVILGIIHSARDMATLLKT